MRRLSPASGANHLRGSGRNTLETKPMTGRKMVGIIQIGFLAQALLAVPATDDSEYVALEKITDRITVAYWLGGVDRRCNLTAIRTQKGLVIIDTEMSPGIMAPIKAKLERTLGRDDWAYVINTHAHDSHAGGNCLFSNAVVVGHTNLAADMREWLVRRQTDSEWRMRELQRLDQFIQYYTNALSQASRRRAADAHRIRGEIRFLELQRQDLRDTYPVIKPSLTFRDKHTLELGDVQLQLVFFGKSHSTSDILIYVPQERVLVTGSAVYQRAQFPEISEQSRLADVRRFIAVLNQFTAPEVRIDRVIPSHSPLLLKSDLLPVRDYYQRMLTGLGAAKQQGLTFEQVQARFPASQFPALKDPPEGWWSHGFHERNLRNLWRILNEQPAEGAPGTDVEKKEQAGARPVYLDGPGRAR